jgi:EAL domain-containing protein (putative c-di-GMP-specific phosphodiesterase class I)
VANDAALALVQRQQSKVEELRRLLAPGTIHAVFQPVVRIADGTTAAYVGYSRFPRLGLHGDLSPDAVLALAGEVGLRDELEVACWEAIAAAGSPPDDAHLILNISPAALAHGGLLAVASRLPERLILELAEPPALLSPTRLRDRLAPWRERGARVAVDEGGAGHAALEQMVQLRPDFLRISRPLVAGLEGDANSRARLRCLVAFSQQAGATLVATGVETEGQLAVLYDAGVELAMGWLFGKPAAPWPVAARVPVTPHSAPATPPPATLMPEPPSPTASLVASGQALVDAALDDLAERGLSVAVYVEQAGVLRCRAARGHWQVVDGLPVGELRDEQPGVLSLPCMDGGTEIGFLRVAAPAGELTPDQIASAELCARVVGPRLAATHPPRPAQLLARRARRLAALLDARDIARETAAAARELSGLGSAAVLTEQADGEFTLEAVDGPHGSQLEQFARSDWALLASWLEGASSCFSTGVRDGAALPGAERLRDLGIGSVAAVPLTAGGRARGMLLAVDAGQVGLEPEIVELLELLGTLAAGGLEAAASFGVLREQASTDPVTGLPLVETLPDVLAQLGPGAAIAAVAVPAGAEDDVVRTSAEILRRSAPEEARLLRSAAGLLAVFVPEGAAHAQTVAALIEARGMALPAPLAATVVTAGEGEPPADLAARCEAALLGNDESEGSPLGAHPQP